MRMLWKGPREKSLRQPDPRRRPALNFCLAVLLVMLLAPFFLPFFVHLPPEVPYVPSPPPLTTVPPANPPITPETRIVPESPVTPIVNPYVPYTYKQLLLDAQKLHTAYPDLITLDSIGKSVEGRDLLLIRLGRGNREITLNGAHHAREYISSALLMKMVETYAACYHEGKSFQGYDVRSLLDQVSIYLVPMVNPDGVTLVQKGISGVQDPESVRKLNGGQADYESWKANIRGVDLNYQYPYYWEKLRNLKGPAPEGYKGSSPSTEPEVRALMDFTYRHPFLLHAAYHAQGEIIYWYVNQQGKLYDESLEIGRKLAAATGYRLLDKQEQHNSFGGYKDWTVNELKKPGYTIELCPYTGPFPYLEKDFDNVWEKAASSGLLLASEASRLEGYEYQVVRDGKVIQVFDTRKDAEGFANRWGGIVTDK